MSSLRWVALAGFVTVVAALMLAVARLELGAAAALVVGFAAYSAVLLRNAERAPAHVVRRAPSRRGRTRAALAARRARRR